ncbi:MAG: prolipoprotein diacylglyceryl transferase [Paludibacteraceae bacterium]|nr:prolipoprotein diacylglyceryl transferase [Paludibacteraceae bacterium]
MLSYITWTVDPCLFSIGPLTVRWYGLMWAAAFFFGYWVESKIYKKEGMTQDQMDKLFLYMLVGTVVGARIGHCLFYDPSRYLSRPYEILYVWEGGLSSHGGACGIIISLWLFNRNVAKKTYIWIMDRIVIAVAIGGAFIRLGNLMNHEIYGHATDVPWAFEFIKNIHHWQEGADPVFSAPSHPTQIYEAIYCLVTFSILMFLYWRTNARKYEGFIFGIFLIGVFLTRFILEFIKNNQEDFEDDMMLNMGQLLSIPLILWGIYLLYKSIKQMKGEEGLKITHE